LKFAAAKQLGFALKAYNKALLLRLRLTVHTYTNMINACVRCGEIDRAMEYLDKMSAAHIKPNDASISNGNSHPR
jgi:pentatricopeptide repeat protein